MEFLRDFWYEKREIFLNCFRRNGEFERKCSILRFEDKFAKAFELNGQKLFLDRISDLKPYNYPRVVSAGDFSNWGYFDTTFNFSKKLLELRFQSFPIARKFCLSLESWEIWANGN